MASLSRRDLLKYLGAAGGAAAGGLLAACGGTTGRGGRPVIGAGSSPADFRTPLRVPGTSGLFGIFDVPAAEFEMTAAGDTLPIISGKPTPVSLYNVTAGGSSYLNPIFRVKTGDTFAATFHNNLGEGSIVHWHGLQTDWRMDGHPSLAVPGGGTYRYNFMVRNRAGTYWYHPHPDGKTGKQAYAGLAGMLIVEDDDEIALRDALDLRLGETDIPLLIQDKQFGAGGNLQYINQPMEQMMGFLGDTVLVNLTPAPSLDVGTRLYRFRILNGSNARTYRLAFTRGTDRAPSTIIGTDGGLLDRPYPATEIFLSPGERVDLLFDLRGYAVGETVFLTSLAFDPMENETGTGGMGNRGGAAASSLANGQAFPIMKLVVRRAVPYDRAIPQTLSRVTPIDITGATVRPIRLARAMMQWSINGASFRMHNSLFTVRRNTTEIWELTNDAMSMPHPMHVHGGSFQVLERVNSPRQIKELVVDDRGRLVTDLGWKDTVLVWPGERVRIALDFTLPFAGEQTYLLHCHILEHEDGGMMVNYTVA